MKNTRGFTLIEGLLIFVIVGLLGGTGWYVWNSHNNASSSLSKSDSTNSLTAQKFVLPSNWSWYENSQYGLKVAYPNSWGEPTFDKGDGSKGSIYYIWWWLGSTEFRVDLSFDSEDYVGQGCNDSRGCIDVPTSNIKTDYQKTINGINDGTNFKKDSNGLTELVFHDNSSYVSILTNPGVSTDVLYGYKIVELPKINASAAYVIYQLYSTSGDCSQKLPSPTTTRHCITQDTVNTLVNLLKSTQSL